MGGGVCKSIYNFLFTLSCPFFNIFCLLYFRFLFPDWIICKDKEQRKELNILNGITESLTSIFIYFNGSDNNLRINLLCPELLVTQQLHARESLWSSSIMFILCYIKILTAMVMKNGSFWDMSQYTPIEVQRRFGTGTSHLLLSSPLLGLHFDSKYGVSTLLRNLSNFSQIAWP
jgi:type IV secretory pathway VirB3-like protein